MKRVAIVRPEPGAAETLARAQARGLDAFIVPLFRVEPREWTAPDPAAFDAILFTSANAVRLAGGALADFSELPAFCVGEATAVAASAAGFTVRATGRGGIEALLADIPLDTRILHPGAVHRMTPATAHRIAPVAVYENVAIAPAGVDALNRSVVLLHSPRAARRLNDLAQIGAIDCRTIALAAISRATGSAAGSGWSAVRWADAPVDEALLALAAQLCKTDSAS